LEGADVILPQLQVEAVLADKTYDADKRVIQPLQQRGIEVVIPPKKNRKDPRAYDVVLMTSNSHFEKIALQSA